MGCDCASACNAFLEFGISGIINAWILVIVTVAAAVLTEFIYEKLMHKKVTIQDYQCRCDGAFAGAQSSAYCSHGGWVYLGVVFAILDRKTAFWRSGTELYEPGTCEQDVFF